MIFGKLSIKEIIFVFFSIAFFIFIGAYVVPQFMQQMKLLIFNMTSVELENNRKNSQIFKKYGAAYFHRFDTGSIEMNIACRIGHNPLLWFIPTPNNEQGYKFRQNKHYVPAYELALNKEEEDDDNLSPQERLTQAIKRSKAINQNDEF